MENQILFAKKNVKNYFRQLRSLVKAEVQYYTVRGYSYDDEEQVVRELTATFKQDVPVLDEDGLKIIDRTKDQLPQVQQHLPKFSDDQTVFIIPFYGEQKWFDLSTDSVLLHRPAHGIAVYQRLLIPCSGNPEEARYELDQNLEVIKQNLFLQFTEVKRFNRRLPAYIKNCIVETKKLTYKTAFSEVQTTAVA